jgi:predicted glycoside hydrolase/deacetylase ChbG (UPF0249 family)
VPIHRQLIVNADDLGLSLGVNEGVFQAHANGIVTSASLMVRGAAAREAAGTSAEFPDLSIGLHLDLGEWKFENDEWVPRYQRAPLDDPELLAQELDAQLAIFSDLLGRHPSHIDAHQHAHRNEPLQSLVLARGRELSVPVRFHTPGVRYLGEFYGQDEMGVTYPEHLDTAFLCGLIDTLPEGTTELCCHPAAAVDFDSTYASERQRELETLCDPAVAAALESAQVKLISFYELDTKIPKQ